MSSTEAPERFLCPISMTVMSNPIRTETGHTFERKAIMEWIWFGPATCPMSRKPLHPSTLARDTALEQEIRRWRLENNIPCEAEPEDDDESESEGDDFSVHSEPIEETDMARIMSLRERVLQSRDRRVLGASKETSTGRFPCTTNFVF